MKLNLAQLDGQLANRLLPAYLVSGDEPMLKQEALQLIRKTAKQAGFAERVRMAPDSDEQWEQLYIHLQSSTLLAEKKIIELDCRDRTLNKAAVSLLESYLKKPSPDTLLLIETNKPDDKTRRAAWYRELEKTGAIVTLWPLTREQLPGWILQRAKKYRLTFTQDAAQLLADYAEGNLTAAAQTLEKIFLLKLEQPVTPAHIEQILSDESRFTIFDLTDSVTAGNQAKALRILHALRQDGTEPVLVLWSITRELRLLAQLANEIQQGQTFDALFQKHRIFSRRQAGIRRFLSRTSAVSCYRHLTHAARVDAVIKGAAPGDPWNTLELLCLRL